MKKHLPDFLHSSLQSLLPGHWVLIRRTPHHFLLQRALKAPVRLDTARIAPAPALLLTVCFWRQQFPTKDRPAAGAEDTPAVFC